MVINQQPADLAVQAGAAASFTAAATGSPAPTVQWQQSTDLGATFSNIAGATSTTLSFTSALPQNGYQYRAVFTNSTGSATSTAATLTVTPPPVNIIITTNPSSATVAVGSTATFSAAATGTPAPTVQWQQSANAGLSFSDIAGATSATLSFTAALAQNGYQYRAVFSNSSGSVSSTAATLTVPTPVNISITSNPSSVFVVVGGTATFTAAATGSPAPTVQWQQSTDLGTTFSNIAAATSTTLSFSAALAQSGYQYRAVFSNISGSLSTTAATLSVSSSPITVVPLGVGGEFACAIKADYSVACWGWNSYGQLGSGVSPGNMLSSPTTVTGLSAISQIAAGNWFACALRSAGSVVCWGYGAGGEMGNGTITPQNFVPAADVSGLSDAIQIVAGGEHACALKSDRTVVCWGQGGYGELGNNTTSGSNVPVAVSGLSGVASIGAGANHTCAAKLDGTAWCWGLNTYGALGDGTTTQRLVPVQVSGLSSVTSLAGGGGHTCAIRSDTSVWCWGMNSSGQVGNGPPTDPLVINGSLPNILTTPVAASGLSGALALTAGGSSSCAQLSGGTAACWGHNNMGQLGDGTIVNRLSPVAVSGLATAGWISTAYYFSTCALKTDGSIVCWGDNSSGQLGDGTTTNRLLPTAVNVTGFY